LTSIQKTSAAAPPLATGDNRTLALLRRFILLLWVGGLVGIAAELLLLGHTEGVWQWVPLALIAAGLLALGGLTLTRHRACLRAFQATLLLFVASGFVGMLLHLRGKIEFKRETDPSLAGWNLLRAAVQGAMPPILAPAAMIQLGLLGLAYTYRNPAFLRPTPTSTSLD
jgi:hypothetical protein